MTTPPNQPQDPRFSRPNPQQPYGGASQQPYGGASQPAARNQQPAGQQTGGQQVRGQQPAHGQQAGTQQPQTPRWQQVPTASSNSRPTNQPAAPAPLSAYTSGKSNYGTPTPMKWEEPKQRKGRKNRKPGRGARRTVGVLSVLLPLGIIGGAAAGFFFANQVFSYNEAKLESEVANVLRDDFGLADVEKVNCPAWVKVEQGNSFQCEFEYGEGTQTVTVTQSAQSGQLIVGAQEE